MKKIVRYAMAAVLCLYGAAGCNWLEVDPEIGMTDEDVFGTYKNFKAFFQSAYYGADPSNISMGSLFNIDKNDKRFAFVSTTDAADNGRYIMLQVNFQNGHVTQDFLSAFSFTTSQKPIAYAMFRIIRIANKSIENIGMLRNATAEQREDLLGQAYFVRAYAHMELVRWYGGMPYLDKALGGDDDWDQARLSAGETLRRAAADFQLAYEHMRAAGALRRDPPPGMVGHLQGSEMDLPNATAALALRARALAYAASPLNNEHGQSDWEAAAKAAAEAISAMEEAQFELADISEWKHNFIERDYSNENIWSYPLGSYVARGVDYSAIYTRAQCPINSRASGICPTQNFVDRFETIYGDALNTAADRAAAEALGHFNPQQPYKDLDPRFYLTIVYDGISTPYCSSINIYRDSSTGRWPVSTFSTKSGNVTAPFGQDWFANPTNTVDGYSYTGYYLGKWWNGDLGTKDAAAFKRTDPLIRTAEVYLLYAEAAGEAWGASGQADGCPYTAREALNLVRTRAGMPGILDKYCGDKTTFVDRVRNERCVELAYEGNHYYFDIRRWKTAPQTMTAPIEGMWVESVPVSAEYPQGRIYTRRTIPECRQCTWKDYMYWIPFPDNKANTMVKFVNNPKWQ